MGLFNRKENNSDTVVWRDKLGVIRCLGDRCAQKKCDDTCPIWLVNTATSLSASGEFKQALSQLDKASKIAPDFYDPWNNMGDIYYKLHKYKRAHDSYLKAHSIKLNKSHPIYYLVQTSLDLRLYEECLHWCDEYSKIFSDHLCDNARATAINKLKQRNEKAKKSSAASEQAAITKKSTQSNATTKKSSTANEHAPATKKPKQSNATTKKPSTASEQAPTTKKSTPSSTPATKSSIYNEYTPATICSWLLKEGKKAGYIDNDRTFPNIPEIVTQAESVVFSIFNEFRKYSDDATFNMSPIWATFAGMGAVRFWYDDWDELKENGIMYSLTAPCGFNNMDKFVLDYIGWKFGSKKSDDFIEHIGALPSKTYDRITKVNISDGLGTNYVNMLKAFFYYGMIIEMHELGMN